MNGKSKFNILKSALVVVAILFVYGYINAASWTPPPGTPPNNNVAPLLNTGPDHQAKTGDLEADNLTSRFDVNVGEDLIVGDFISANGMTVFGKTTIAKNGDDVQIGGAPNSSNTSDVRINGKLKIKADADTNAYIALESLKNNDSSNRAPICADNGGKIVLCNIVTGTVTVNLTSDDTTIDPFGFRILNGSSSVAGIEFAWNATSSEPSDPVAPQGCNAVAGSSDWINNNQNKPAQYTANPVADMGTGGNPGDTINFSMECQTVNGSTSTETIAVNVSDPYISQSTVANGCMWDITTAINNIDKPTGGSNLYSSIEWQWRLLGNVNPSPWTTYESSTGSATTGSYSPTLQYAMPNYQQTIEVRAILDRTNPVTSENLQRTYNLEITVPPNPDPSNPC